MITILLNIICITVIVCYILDISGFIDEMKFSIRKWLNIKSSISLKPFDCSLCMSHWLNLIYILYLIQQNVIIFNQALYLYVFVLFLSTNTIFITNTLNFITDFLNKIIDKLWNKITT